MCCLHPNFFSWSDLSHCYFFFDGSVIVITISKSQLHLQVYLALIHRHLCLIHLHHLIKREWLLHQGQYVLLQTLSLTLRIYLSHGLDHQLNLKWNL